MNVNGGFRDRCYPSKWGEQNQQDRCVVEFGSCMTLITIRTWNDFGYGVKLLIGIRIALHVIIQVIAIVTVYGTIIH